LPPKSTSLDDLERTALYCTNDALFGAHRINFKEDRSILSAAKM